jgi:hypothetical protein
MTNTRRLLTHLDETFVQVREGLGSTIDQLHEWTGEFRSTCAGASPASGPPMVRDEKDDADDPKGDRVVLTKVESDALAPDGAKRALARCYEIVDLLVVECGDLGDLLGGEVLPYPVERLAPRLAFVQWQINKTVRAGQVPSSGVGRLEKAVRLVNELHKITVAYRPPADSSAAPAGGCVAHARAGVWEPVDDRYRRPELCRKCGDFQHQFGQLPPPKLVKLAEVHGWRYARSPSTLARFAIRGRKTSTRTG